MPPSRVQPVALARWRRREPEHRRVEAQPAGRSVEPRVAEAEHPAVAGDEPVALPALGRRHPDDRLVEPQVAGRPVESGVAEREHAAVPTEEPVSLARRMPGDADDRGVQADPDHAAGVRQVAEREELTRAGRDPITGGSDRDARCNLHAQVRKHRLDGGAGARRRVRVTVAADVVEPVDPSSLRRDVRGGAERIDAPPRALPRHQLGQGFDHRGARSDVAVVPHEPDADGVRVEVERVRAHDVLAVALAGVRLPGRIRLGPAALVDTTERIDEPVVRDVDVAVVQLVGEDAARQTRVVGDAVGCSGVVHDDLADHRVVDAPGLAQALVRTPLRSRDHRRDRPTELRRQRGFGTMQIEEIR